MFCPECGQQQTSEKISFCSRCGFQLSVIRDLLNSGGAKKAGKDESALPTLVSLMMFIAALLATGASLIYVGPGAHQMLMLSKVMLAITFVFLLSCRPWRLMHRLLFRDPAQIRQVDSAAQEYALPPTQSIPAREFDTLRVKAAEIVQPSSVTEQTTRSLDTRKD
jgi:hypothetical protein